MHNKHKLAMPFFVFSCFCCCYLVLNELNWARYGQVTFADNTRRLQLDRRPFYIINWQFDIRLTIADLAKFTWCRFRMQLDIRLRIRIRIRIRTRCRCRCRLLIHVLESTAIARFEFGAWALVTTATAKTHLIE